MKISVLVAQYFYQHRVLNLPGIGSFYLDDVVDAQSIGDKSSRELIDHIHFAQKNIARPDDELIDFIRKHTGKIKPLAESDLETFVADGKLMLNIGKPFHIEGIGTLQKNKEGIYEFTPGLPVVQRLESPPPIIPLEREQEVPKKKSVFDDDPNEVRNASIRRIAIGIGLVVGVGIILWGGYSLFSNKVQQSSNTVTTSVTNDEDSLRTSSYLQNINDPKKALDNVIKKDSLIINDPYPADTNTQGRTIPPAAATTASPVIASGPTKVYKFILQTTKYRPTAEKMYNKLKPRVQLEAVDSTLFKIVINVPGTPADTTRIKDSLRFWYWGARNNPVTIEQ
ncbi:hypothetical protein FAM09_20800 [Niastella caeni]|uniref:CCDC81-like prokaryotic HU domain-containing protein n=1 Tax=Niastella caeni TaxID=2569763 RepID=A0A4V4H0A6_9BACT|nr:hypothetical protein [Niastella caeni]THU35836.1 hypothetical protein FAM09_20800 [Niastella caeni]